MINPSGRRNRFMLGMTLLAILPLSGAPPCLARVVGVHPGPATPGVSGPGRELMTLEVILDSSVHPKAGEIRNQLHESLRPSFRLVSEYAFQIQAVDTSEVYLADTVQGVALNDLLGRGFIAWTEYEYGPSNARPRWTKPAPPDPEGFSDTRPYETGGQSPGPALVGASDSGDEHVAPGPGGP